MVILSPWTTSALQRPRRCFSNSLASLLRILLEQLNVCCTEHNKYARANNEDNRRNSMTNPLLELKNLGQSVWYDNIDRAQLISGQFQRLMNEDGIVGVTANPTIFEKSISSGHAYDEQMTQLINEGKGTSEIYEALIIKDIQTVADMLRPVY